VSAAANSRDLRVATAITLERRQPVKTQFLSFSIPLLFCAMALPACAAQAIFEVTEFITAKGTAERLSPRPALKLDPLPQPDESFATVMVDTSETFQTIIGIGGALTDASAEVYARLPAGQQKKLLTAYFDVEQGIGYSLCRTNIHSCDFSSDSYTYAPAGDKDLVQFSIEHDKRFRLPFIRAALAAAPQPFKLFASPWSPPEWMKTNGSVLHGGQLKPEFAETWAEYYGRFIHAYEKEGIRIWGLTVQNEPMAEQSWESCVFTGDEERAFVRDHLGPALGRAGLAGVKLMIWDHNRGIMYQRAKAVYDDPAAAKYIWGTAFHWYVGDHFDNVRLVHEAWPDKNLLMTEACLYPFDPARFQDWSLGEAYGNSMIHDLNNWAVGWTDWNVLLDERGGPNHVGNYCFAPVHADTRSGTLTYLNSYYYIGHFSKFIRPGARRVATTLNDDRLLASAFLNPDGRVAVVVLNLRDESIDFKLWIDGQAAATNSPAHSIITFVH
jgi:glucosylceramidase